MIQSHLEDDNLKGSLIRITGVFWAAAKIITYKLWLSDRLFPLVPPFKIFNETPAPVHLFLFVASLTCLAALVAKPTAKFFLITLFAAEILSCLLDQNRWQPWEYQYVFMVFIFLFYSKRPGIVVHAVGFVLCCTYFYSGISKFNNAFIERVWSDVILMRFFKLSESTADSYLLKSAGFAIPLFEAGCGLALFFNKSRRISATALLIMHIFNLLLLGPLGINFNPAVWPWNVAMILYLKLIFLSSRDFSYKPIMVLQAVPVVLFWGVLPALNAVGRWDSYLLSNLYSGKTKDMIVCFKSNNLVYPNELQPFFSKRDSANICKQGKLLSISTWSLRELKVPCYPEERILGQVKEIIKIKYPACDPEFFISGEEANSLKRF